MFGPFKKIKKEYVWLTCLGLGAILAFLSVYYPRLIMVAIVFIIIGIKGILVHVM